MFLLHPKLDFKHILTPTQLTKIRQSQSSFVLIVFRVFSRCTVVLYNVRKNRQSHVLNASRKSVTCVAFSPDGRYLATGECGHAPAVRVWDLQVTYIPLTLYPRRGSRGISDILPRHPRFTKISCEEYCRHDRW
jgi:WD40 repeat protein